MKTSKPVVLSGASKQKSKFSLSPMAEMDEEYDENIDAHAPKHRSMRNGKDTNKPERQVTMTEVKGSGLGSKQASLYLSRNASLIRTGTRDSRRTGKNTENDTSSYLGDSGSEKSSKSAFIQREFTFTGYDIMADVDPDTRKPQKSEDQTKEDENVQCYIASCKLLGITPVNYLTRHINDKQLVMRSHPLGYKGTRAVCVALVKNTLVECIDFEDNDIGVDGAVCLVEMLKENSSIQEVRIAENMIGTRGAYAFAELMKDGKTIHTLDISGSGLKDSDAKYIAEIIEFNTHIKILNISHNELGENGAFDVARAIAINDTLQELDMSWNHIRGKGALAVAIGMQKNVVLKALNLSWNGFGKEGAAGIGRALEENRTLLSLDISNNRFGADSVGFILKGLQNNDGLKTLKIGQNPFSPEIALTILRTIEESEKCVLTHLDLSDVVVRTDFLEKWDEIKRKREMPLRIIFGAVVKSTNIPMKDPNGIDWRDPVVRMFKYMQDQGYRVIDLLKRLDKDRSFSVDRQEFKNGLMAENIPLTESQLDDVIDRLDADGDGEVDLGAFRKILKRADQRGKRIPEEDACQNEENACTDESWGN
ncbi:Leucine Rich repeat [Mactra antiquata]